MAPEQRNSRTWDHSQAQGVSVFEVFARMLLFVQALAIAYIGYGHLLKPEGNLPEMGFTFKPRREDTKERMLLLRHLCAILGASHLARAGACLLSIAAGGTALVCGFAGELIFVSISIYAYKTFPSGTGAKGSPLEGPVDLMKLLIGVNLVGLVFALISRMRYRRKVKSD